jgi:hypothetical protein
MKECGKGARCNKIAGREYDSWMKAGWGAEDGQE